MEMDNYLNDVKLSDEKFLITGKGRVGSGILETIKKLNIEEVNIDDYLNKRFDQPVYLNIDVMDYNTSTDGKDSTFSDFLNDSSLYKSDIW